jgi:exopolysaccharide biosynthesis protein
MLNELTITTGVSVSAVIISLLTVVVSVWAAKRSNRNHALRSNLIQAYRDVQAFYLLEQAYCEELSSLKKGMSADAVKRATRKLQRINGNHSPSEYSTPAKLDQHLSKLLRETT